MQLQKSSGWKPIGRPVKKPPGMGNRETRWRNRLEWGTGDKMEKPPGTGSREDKMEGSDKGGRENQHQQQREGKGWAVGEPCRTDEGRGAVHQ